LLRSCKLVEVTESEAEYHVTCVKHIYPRHVLLQFNVTNNMQQILSDVMIEIESDNPEWAEEMAVPLDELKPSASGTCFVCLSRPEGAFSSGLLHNTLKFRAREVGEDLEDAFDDTYHLEEVEVLPTDFIKPGVDQQVGDFRNDWEALGSANEVVKRFNLSVKEIQEAANGIIQLSSMKAIADSDKVAEGSKSHTVNLSGVFITGEQILTRAGFAIQDGKPGIILKIASRSNNSALSSLVPNAIR
jgi:coatomer subunit gamma